MQFSRITEIETAEGADTQALVTVLLRQPEPHGPH